MLALPWLCTCENNKCGTSPATIMMYVQGALWVVCLLFDRYYRHKHNQNRMYGYLEFYRQTRQWRRIPLLVTSGGISRVILSIYLIEYHPHNTEAGSDSGTFNIVEIYNNFDVFDTTCMTLFYFKNILLFLCHRECIFHDRSRWSQVHEQ